MQLNGSEDVRIQRNYYAETALDYDKMHLKENDEHFMAASFMAAIIDFLHIGSILDIGSGTGRIIAFIKEKHPDIRIIGVEPVVELREAGYRKGISRRELIEGDALDLNFEDGQFDMVCSFAVLHHIKHPQNAVSEMLRVSKKAVFISDANNFGQGTAAKKMFKQILHAFGLWTLFNLLKTKGRGYTISAGDGLAYSYSVFDNYNQIKSRCHSVHVLNTNGSSINHYRNASQVAMLGIKK